MFPRSVSVDSELLECWTQRLSSRFCSVTPCPDPASSAMRCECETGSGCSSAARAELELSTFFGLHGALDPANRPCISARQRLRSTAARSAGAGASVNSDYVLLCYVMFVRYVLFPHASEARIHPRANINRTRHKAEKGPPFLIIFSLDLKILS